jgi:2-polyprenyl-3-methyl-5-hydroxy-6-metoxy-1,4-benzoquinol methylase
VAWSGRGRVDGEEWLERGRLSRPEVVRNLRDMEVVNRRLGGTRSVLAHMQPVFASLRPGDSATVLDVASGGGDLLRAVARVARARGVRLHAIGLDLHPEALRYARSRSRHYPELCWIRGTSDELPFPPRSFDLVVCSCFLHHLSPERATEFLREAAEISRGWVIAGDLVRSRSAYLAFCAVAPILGLHPVTRHDGAVSIQRAYSPDEVAAFAAAAGLSGWRLQRHPFARMTLTSRVNGKNEVQGGMGKGDWIA